MTIKDIARESGYGVSTVSRALNDHPDVSQEAKEKIRAVVERYGFVPNANARQLKVQQRNCICLIVKGAFNLFFAGILERMQLRISEAGYGVEVQYIDELANEVALAQQMQRELKPQGILFLGGNVHNFVQSFASVELPCVLAAMVSQEVAFPNLSMVGVDDRAVGAEAYRYLHGMGHQYIGVIGGTLGESYICTLRYEGFAQACRDDGVEHDVDLYQEAPFGLVQGHAAMWALLRRHPEITAVFCMSDMLALGAMRAAHEMGAQVPGTISLIGVDGLELGAFSTPQLASIRQPQEAIADQSVKQLLAQIERGARARTTVLPVALEAGESVAARPQP